MDIFIFLDDIRNPPTNKWTLCRDCEKVFELIIHHTIHMQRITLSLDHDLGENQSTGYELLCWLEKKIVVDKEFIPWIDFVIHSANPVGVENMERAISSIQKLIEGKLKDK